MVWQIVSWWKWYWKAKGRYKIHSPRIAYFVKWVLEDTRWFYPFDALERAREKLLHDQSILTIEDHGAGQKTGKRSVQSIAATALSPDWQCRLLFRMVCAYPHALVLEMGTSLGVSTAYLAKASGKGRVMALEGAPALAEAAQSLHQQFQIRNVQWQVGPFQTTLEPLLNSLETSIDFIYLDGHHQGEAVLAYTRQLLPYISDNGLLVVDDIRWSKDMYAAWQELQRSGAFDTCLDLGWAGVLFKGDQAPLEEAIIPWRWKPWQLGFLAT